MRLSMPGCSHHSRSSAWVRKNLQVSPTAKSVAGFDTTPSCTSPHSRRIMTRISGMLKQRYRGKACPRDEGVAENMLEIKENGMMQVEVFGTIERLRGGKL